MSKQSSSSKLFKFLRYFNLLDLGGYSWLQGWWSWTPNRFKMDPRMIRIILKRFGVKTIIQLPDIQIYEILIFQEHFLDTDRCSWLQGWRSGNSSGFKMEPRMLRNIIKWFGVKIIIKLWHIQIQDIEISETLPWLCRMFLTPGMEIRNPK